MQRGRRGDRRKQPCSVRLTAASRSTPIDRGGATQINYRSIQHSMIITHKNRSSNPGCRVDRYCIVAVDINSKKRPFTSEGQANAHSSSAIPKHTVAATINNPKTSISKTAQRQPQIANCKRKHGYRELLPSTEADRNRHPGSTQATRSNISSRTKLGSAWASSQPVMRSVMIVSHHCRSMVQHNRERGIPGQDVMNPAIQEERVSRKYPMVRLPLPLDTEK